MNEIKRWDEISVGTEFRWVGGVTTFIKVSPETAVVLGQNASCHPSAWEQVVPLFWSSLT